MLYERLRLPELPAAARRRVLIASALWGVVAPDDRIPAYRLSISARLPRIAGLAATGAPRSRRRCPTTGWWSTCARAATRPRGRRSAPPWSAVRGFTPEGKVISHFVKAIRGDVARALLLAPEPPRTAEDVAEIAARGLEAALTARAST